MAQLVQSVACIIEGMKNLFETVLQIIYGLRLAGFLSWRRYFWGFFVRDTTSIPDIEESKDGVQNC